MKVQVLLKTALYRGKFGPDRTELGSSVMEIRGRAEVRDGGLDIQISDLYDERGRAVTAPFRRVFVPTGKIDFYVIDAA